MPKDVPSGLQAEYDALRAQTLAFARYFASIGARRWHDVLEKRGVEPVTRSVVEGWREARSDCLEATRALSGRQLRELGQRLLAECGVTLDSLQVRRLKRLADLRARRRLTTDEQYRLVMSRVDEVGDEPAGEEELRELVALIDQYEGVIQRRLERQAKHRDRAG